MSHHLIKVKKLNKREDRRRIAAYQISRSLISKRQLSEQEAIQYFFAISKRSVAYFGIVKLSDINLNAQYETHLLQDLRTKDLMEKTCLYSKLTLLQYACFMKADAIVSALLRLVLSCLVMD